MDVSSYAGRAEEFLARLTTEFYRHGAGLKEELEISGIFEQHADLFAREAVAGLIASRGTREGRYLADFAASGWIEHTLRETTEEIGTEEARAVVKWGGEGVPWWQASIMVANEPDLTRRHDLEKRMTAVTAQLNPTREERLDQAHGLARELGFENYVTMCEELGELDLAALARAMGVLLEDTRACYEQLLGERLAAAGIAASEVTTGDLHFLRRGREFDAMFPKDDLLPALRRTLAGMGMDLEAQANLRLDLEERPLKSPRAFCAPIRVPQEVWLVIRPHGGHDDYGAILHEAGHAEHFAHACADAPFAFRCLGDNAVTESYAFLLGGLTRSAAWLREVLGAERAEAYLALASFGELYMLRRYAAKLLYELELHRASDLHGFPRSYAETLGSALYVSVWPENFVYDVDDAFYCARYLRAWMLEVHLRDRLNRDLGANWFANVEAGDFLKELWALGQELTADELATRLGYQGLEVGALIDDLLATPA